MPNRGRGSGSGGAAAGGGGSDITSGIAFRGLLVLLSLGLFIQFSLLLFPMDIPRTVRETDRMGGMLTTTKSNKNANKNEVGLALRQEAVVDENEEEEEEEDSQPEEVQEVEENDTSHFYPLLKPLPALATIEDGNNLAEKTLDGTRPTIKGIAIILQRFLLALHKANKELAQDPNVHSETVPPVYVDLVKEYLLPFDQQYRGKSIFPVRTDNSIFISAAAFRDHLFGKTLKDAFKHARHPEKLYIGAVIQNCFGLDYTCQTGVEVVGKDAKGEPITKISDTTPDQNGIEEFCTDPHYAKYCDSGQVRVLYVNETESSGPSTARYFASKLWGGETYFIQIDAHLQFAQDWDIRYISEMEATSNYPKSILSAYPPDFGEESANVGSASSRGTRLCGCFFAEENIIRIAAGKDYNGNERKPTQIPFMAAGFFMARGDLLKDVPFDPLLPWTFMGEEIGLSMRSWTAGWDIYAPRINLIAHQYRPGSMGLPKFWESVGRTYGRPSINNNMEIIMIDRIKFMLEYPETIQKVLKDQEHDYILTDIEYYGLNTIRSRNDYIRLTGIDFVNKKCPKMKWCNKGELV